MPTFRTPTSGLHVDPAHFPLEREEMGRLPEGLRSELEKTWAAGKPVLLSDSPEDLDRMEVLQSLFKHKVLTVLQEALDGAPSYEVVKNAYLELSRLKRKMLLTGGLRRREFEFQGGKNYLNPLVRDMVKAFADEQLTEVYRKFVERYKNLRELAQNLETSSYEEITQKVRDLFVAMPENYGEMLEALRSGQVNAEEIFTALGELRVWMKDDQGKVTTEGALALLATETGEDLRAKFKCLRMANGVLKAEQAEA